MIGVFILNNVNVVVMVENIFECNGNVEINKCFIVYENICKKVNDIGCGDIFVYKGIWLCVEYFMLLFL